jgi:diguanylate cyclase (GGDEF)-like protein/PAS domain S-box-containing protein
MPGQKINFKKVANACDKIKQRGDKPSLTNVCDELSLIRITPDLNTYLNDWYRQQPEFQRSFKNPLSENLIVDTNHIIEKNIELEKSLSLVKATLESTADGIMMVNGKGQVVDWNQKFVEMWRIPSHMLESGTESIGFDYILDQVADPQALINEVKRLYENPYAQGKLEELHFKDGRIFERYSQPQFIGDEIVGRVWSFRDVTQKRMAENELRIREKAIEASSHGVVIINVLDKVHPIIYVNTAFQKITGYTEKQVLGQNLKFLLEKKSDQVNQKRIELAIREGREEEVELESFRRNGECFWNEMCIAPVKDDSSEIKYYVCIINDVTSRREMEEQLVKQATHDALTNLPNRSLLLDRVNQAIRHAKKVKKKVAMLFLDLDRFKLINDTLGHTIGDKLLQAVANRILLVTEDEDTIARIGGDEFITLLTNLDREEDAECVAKNILSCIEKPFQVEQHSLKLTASIGISFYPKDGDDYELLMKNADLSMYYAKDTGRNNFQIFDQEMNRRIINHVQLDNALRDAMDLDEFSLHYQPLIDLKSNKVIGTEALIRWNSHLLGPISPMEFIPMAEENGLIIDIGNWVLEQACLQMVRWHNMGFNDLIVAVNISGRQFRQKNLPKIVDNILCKTGLDPHLLELELTESLLVEDIDHVVDMMFQMKDMGVRVVIDDFGTGYSSLSYLKQFPVDKLKIDRSFITDLLTDDNDAAIAKAIINLGHSLNMKVLAEGVENEKQRQFMLSHNCDFAQGYFFKRPEVAENIIDFLINFNKKNNI